MFNFQEIFNKFLRLYHGYGNVSYLARSVKILGRKKITLGSKCKIFDFVTLDSRFHPALAPYYSGREFGLIRIGRNCKIKEGVKILSYEGEVNIGDNVSVNPYCIIYGNGGVNIGNNVLIAAHTVIVSSNHVFNNKYKLISQQGMTSKGISIADNVWIGANSTILDGVSIGYGAVIAAGSVVNRSVEPYSVFGGVPARKIRMIE
jgi:acetyltransferase-like isoleucine patch superfamily enzyme